MKAKILFVLLLAGMVTQAQNPVKWSFSAKKISEKEYEVHITATIESGWSTYSQTTPDGGPLPTAITFSKNPLLELKDKVKEVGTMKKKHEEVFGVDVHYYKEKVDFVQVVKVKNNVKTSINGKVEFMVCDDEQCLPPDEVAFSIKLQ